MRRTRHLSAIIAACCDDLKLELLECISEAGLAIAEDRLGEGKRLLTRALRLTARVEQKYDRLIKRTTKRIAKGAEYVWPWEKLLPTK